MDITIDGSVIAILGVGIALAGLILKLHRDTNDRIDRIETRIDRLETRMDRLETRVQAVESGLSRVEGFIEGFLLTQARDQSAQD